MENSKESYFKWKPNWQEVVMGGIGALCLVGVGNIATIDYEGTWIWQILLLSAGVILIQLRMVEQ